ncbi:Hypothetical protein A7982_09286 [Minicystis rosea]|nr:Hypothetical protein A7982_09286 [Minicystis rosea]
MDARRDGVTMETNTLPRAPRRLDGEKASLGLPAKLALPMGAALALTLTSCAASRMRDLSSAKLGCAPEETAISNEHFGLNASTWTATCRGRTFHCTSRESAISKANPSPAGKKAPEVEITKLTPDVSCVEAKPKETSARVEPREAPARKIETPDIAPKGAGGFSFGMDVLTAGKLCINAGHRWDEPEKDQYRCSGTVADIGHPAETRLRFCDEKLCAIHLDVHLADEKGSEWVALYQDLWRALAVRYGNTSKRADQIPSTCKERMTECLEDGTARLDSRWQWPDGKSIRLLLGRIGKEPGIEITYRDTAREAPKVPAGL